MKGKFLRSGLALLLAVCMIVGFVPATVFAEPVTKDTITYVSIGDSMTNGYGLDGYDGSSGIVNYAKQTYGNQFAKWLSGYTGSIENDQVIFEGPNAVVDHRQLAMSGLRAEDLHWILELDYEDEALMKDLFNKWYTSDWDEVKGLWYGAWGFKTGDYRTWSDFCDGDYRYADGAARILRTYGKEENKKYFQSSYATAESVQAAKAGVAANPYFPQNKSEAESIGGHKYLQISTEFFQKSVADADVISLALGNTNFGTYMLNEIMDVIMNNDLGFTNTYDIEKVFALADLDPKMEAAVRKVIDEYDVIIEKLFSGLANGDAAKMEALRDIIVYCAVSYIVNYIGSVDAILALNPDADIIQVALMNVYAVEDETVKGQTTLGDMVDILYDPINKFLPALPAVMQTTGNARYEQATFYYAEADTVGCLVDVFGDDFYKKSGSYVKYPGLLNGTEDYEPNLGSTVRDRIIAEIVRGQTFRMMNDMGIGVDTNLTVEEIAAYDMMKPAQKAAYAAQNADKAKSIALYLAFENASIEAGKKTVTMDSLAALSGVASAFAGIIGPLQQNATAYGKANYLDGAAAVVAAGSGGALTADAVKLLVAGGDEAIYQYIAGRSGGQLTAAQVKALYEAADHDAAIYGYVASLSGGLLSAEAVKNLSNAVNAAPNNEAKSVIIYNTVATIANNALLPASVIESLYESPDRDVAIDQYITSVVKEQTAANENVAQLLPLHNNSVDEILICVQTSGYHAYCPAIKAEYQNALSNAIDTYTPVMKRVVEGVDQLWTAVNGVNSLKGVITNIDSLKYAVGSAETLCYLLGLPQTLSNAMVEDSTLSGILCMNARCLIGTGIGGHPSEGGHDALSLAVIDTFASGHTSKDETMEHLKVALDLLMKEIQEHGPVMAAHVWQQWIDAGYVGMVEETIAELKAMLQARYEYYTTEAVPAIEEAVNALVAEKANLDAELIDLKAQLEAKKAELAKVIAEQEISDVNLPNIKIEVDLGNNTQTTLPDYECKVEGEGIKAELEAAIRDLEHAIATVEALIADIEADIADMAALAEQIANAVAELEKTMADVAKAVADLEAAFKAIEEVLTNDSAKQTADQMNAAFAAARSTALAAAEVLELVMNTAGQMADDIDMLIAKLAEDGEALYKKVKEDLPAALAYVQNLPKHEQMVLAALAAATKKGAEVLKAELPGKIAEIQAEYAPKIAAAEAKVAELEAQIQAEISAKYAEAEKTIKAEYAAKSEELKAAKAELEVKAAEAKAELEAELAKLAAAAEEAAKAEIQAKVEVLQAQYDRLAKDLATVSADLEHAAEHLDAALTEAYNKIVAEVTAAYEKAMAELKQAVADLNAAMEKAIADLEAAVDAQVKALEAELAKLEKQLTDAINGVLADIKQKLDNELKGLVDAVEAMKATLVQMGIDSIEELAEALVNLVNDILYKATHADLTIDNDFKYVALGDGTAEAKGYAEELVKYLNEEADKNGVKDIKFVNEAKAGNTVSAEIANLSEEVKDADLITLGFSQTEMMGRAIEALLKNESVDWAALLGEDAVPYVEKALAKVNAEIDALELGEYSEMLKALLEAYAYSVVEYTVSLPVLVHAIRTVNKDAVVMVVGMYNPVAEAVIDVKSPLLGEIYLELGQMGEYFNYLVDAAQVYGVALAVVTDTIDYVDARDVEIAKATLGVAEITSLLTDGSADALMEALYPSAAGDSYIAMQIAKALNLSFAGLLGDANNDGIVDSYDAFLIAEYDVGNIDANGLVLSNCDVSGDGIVDSYDAFLIAEYDVGNIEKFPAA